jgi:8-oxo-dGTP pyrophosphatase MutT (NUDIX family)
MSRAKGRLIRQACALPYRWRGGELEFCLITSRSGLWSFPKGIIEPSDTAEETALKESREEAGLRGVLENESLGQFAYGKWGCDLVVDVFLMRVTAEDDRWPEAAWRRRFWCPAAEAHRRLGRKALREFLSVALEQVGRTRRTRRTG